MRGSSLASLEAIEAGFDAALATADGKQVEIGKQLFAVVDLLDASGALRRALTDPARDSAAKTTLVHDLFGAQAHAVTVDVVAAAATSRWSHVKDFVDALERLAAVAVLAGAQSAGRLEQVGRELWEASQTMARLPEIRTALTDRRATPTARIELLRTLFTDRVSDETLALIERTAGAPRGVHLVPALQRYNDLVALRRNRMTARVIASAPPSDEQLARIEALVQRAYGRDIQVDFAIDPAVVGGLRIQVGSDVLDSTVLARLADVRRKLAS